MEKCTLHLKSETVFYSGNLSFSAEKLSLSPVFSNGKHRYIRKIQGLTRKRGYLVEQSTLHVK